MNEIAEPAALAIPRLRSSSRREIRPPPLTTCSSPPEPARPGRLGTVVRWRAASRAAHSGAGPASGAAVGRDADVAEALGHTVGVRRAVTRLRAEDVLGAEALEVAVPTEAPRAIADVAAARSALGAPARATKGAARISPTEPMRPPLPAAVGGSRRATADENGWSPCRSPGCADPSEKLAARDLFGFHAAPPVLTDLLPSCPAGADARHGLARLPACNTACYTRRCCRGILCIRCG